MLRKYIRVYLLIILLVFVTTITACQSPPEYANEHGTDNNTVITIATGGTTGPYFAIANGMAQLFDQKLPGFSTSVRSTGGGVENIQLLLDKKVELGLVMADIASFSFTGKKIEGIKEGKNLRAVAALYPNYVHIISLKKTGIMSVEDLKGKKVGVGAVGSGTEVNARTILKYHGITYDDIDEYYLSYKESVNALRNGDIDAAFLTSGLPNAMVLDLVKTNQVQFIPIAEAKVKEIAKKYPYYSSREIPKNIYGNAYPIHTAAITNILLTREDMPDDLIYDITKTIFENTDKLSKAHSAAADISLENSQIGLTVPLHNGAKKFFDEYLGKNTTAK